MEKKRGSGLHKHGIVCHKKDGKRRYILVGRAKVPMPFIGDEPLPYDMFLLFILACIGLTLFLLYVKGVI